MKHQALFSLKDKSKKIKLPSAAILFVFLRVNVKNDIRKVQVMTHCSEDAENWKTEYCLKISMKYRS